MLIGGPLLQLCAKRITAGVTPLSAQTALTSFLALHASRVVQLIQPTHDLLYMAATVVPVHMCEAGQVGPSLDETSWVYGCVPKH